MAEPGTDSVITVDGLRVRYRGADRDAVGGISFTVAAGEVFGFLGPNGAGKSTTQQVLTRLLRGHTGRIEVFGRPLEGWGPDYYEHIGVGFELPAHFSRLTARENLTTFAALYAGPTDDPQELLDAVGLGGDADRVVATFSKGMQMRLNLARALVNQPEVLFLDEPTSGLDPVHTALVRTLVREQVRRGRTVVLTTHDMATADALCDRVAFMVDGRIAAVDTPRGFRLGYGRAAVTVEYRDPDPGPGPDRDDGGDDGQHQRDGLRRREFPLAALGTDPGFLELVRSGTVETIHTREASLDEVFVQVTGGRL